jgi:hypothetical protein
VKFQLPDTATCRSRHNREVTGELDRHTVGQRPAAIRLMNDKIRNPPGGRRSALPAIITFPALTRENWRMTVARRQPEIQHVTRVVLIERFSRQWRHLALVERSDKVYEM